MLVTIEAVTSQIKALEFFQYLSFQQASDLNKFQLIFFHQELLKLLIIPQQFQFCLCTMVSKNLRFEQLFYRSCFINKIFNPC